MNVSPHPPPHNSFTHDSFYRLDDVPPLGKRLLYSLQFVVIFIGSIVLVPSIAAGSMGWDQETVTFLLQCAIFTGGLATVVQARGLGPVGARLPILCGTTFVIILPMISITQAYGYDAFLGAVVAGGVGYALITRFGFQFLQRVFNSTVSGTVILSIALTLAPSCADMIDAPAAPWKNWLMALVSMVICLAGHLFARGFLQSISLFLGLAAGYATALALGQVSFGGIATASWFSIPKPLAYGLSFQWQPILIMLVIYMVTMVEFIGDTTATAMVCCGRLPTQQELRGGLLCDALSSVLSGLFNFAPNISYSDGIGIIGTTKVASRSVVLTSGLLITAAGLVPKFSALLYTVPGPVLGGTCLFLTGIMLIAGLKVILTQPLTLRNSVIIGTSLAVGIGFGSSGVLSHAPMVIQTLFSGIPGTALVGGFLNLTLPKE